LEAKKHIVKKQIEENLEKNKINSKKKEEANRKTQNPSKKKNTK